MKIKKLIYGLLGAGGVLVACDKIEEGYMSSNIYYVTDPFTVEQGLTTYSEALELDNSTGPVNVELLDIRNVETGKTEEAWYSESEITFWKEKINSETDTTWEQVFYAALSDLSGQSGGRTVGIFRGYFERTGRGI